MANLIFSDNFDGGVASGSWNEVYFNATSYTPNTSEAKYEGSSPAPVDGSHCVHYFAQSGTNEIDAVKLDYAFASDISEVFISWREFFATGYPWPTSSQKLFRLYYYNESFPASRKEIGVLVQTANADVNLQLFCGLWGDSSLCNVDSAIHSNEAHPENQWVKWSVHVKLNTPGSSDGFIKLYKNDTLYLSGIDIDLRGTDTKGFSNFWIGGNYSMLSGGTLASDGHRYIDKVEVYDGDPGASGPSLSKSKFGQANPGFNAGFN